MILEALEILRYDIWNIQSSITMSIARYRESEDDNETRGKYLYYQDF